MTQDINLNDYYTTKELNHQFGIHRAVIDNWIKRHSLLTKKVKGVRLINKESFHNYRTLRLKKGNWRWN